MQQMDALVMHVCRSFIGEHAFIDHIGRFPALEQNKLFFMPVSSLYVDFEKIQYHRKMIYFVNIMVLIASWAPRDRFIHMPIRPLCLATLLIPQCSKSLAFDSWCLEMALFQTWMSSAHQFPSNCNHDYTSLLLKTFSPSQITALWVIRSKRSHTLHFSAFSSQISTT